jgi:hypothetical protein
VLSVLGCLVLWVRSRQPGSMEAHIRDFERELDALAPERQRGRPARGTDDPESRRSRG